MLFGIFSASKSDATHVGYFWASSQAIQCRAKEPKQALNFF
jgi:hypothetical protein